MSNSSLMHRINRVGVAAIAGSAVLTASSAASAQGAIYRCTNSSGVVEYGNAAPVKGQKCQKIALPAITTVPAGPKVAKKASKSKAPAAGARSADNESAASFPKVTPTAQTKRDNDRKRILKEELGREEKRLAVLRKEYKNGEPDRRGNERNYQRYLDRVEKMKADIARVEGNVDALRRELASSKN